MNSSRHAWLDENQRYFSAAIAVVQSRLVERLQQASMELPMLAHIPSVEVALQQFQALETTQPPPALEQLCQVCQLSSFEQEILLLCAGMELDATFAPIFAALHGDAQRNYPTFSLAMGNLPEASWAALSTGASLRHWQLVEVGPGRALTTSPLRIDERVLHFLTGSNPLDEQLVGIVKPLAAASELVPSHRTLAERLVKTWVRSRPVLQLWGGDGCDRTTIAQTAATQLGLTLHRLAAESLPTAALDLNRLARRWQREATFSQSGLLLEWAGKPEQASVVSRFIEDLSGLVILSSPTRQHLAQVAIAFEVALPTSAEQQHLWQSNLGTAAIELNGHLEQITSQFNLNAPMIEAAYSEALGSQSQSDAPQAHHLWQACRNQARPRLESLAQRIPASATWEDLVLPETQLATLQELEAHLRQRTKVYQTWGFAGQSGRGLGITALFAGASGTGKTLAAEVLAYVLDLDLYKIDLSAIISKYIGETEKNLSRIFDAAETGGAILLFDEADALFGKRNEVKDSHDRYANIEVSYLLQRMEAYRGLAILTTNLPDAIDRAFMRRIRFMVQFSFPDWEQRTTIWQRMFPVQTPTDGLNFRQLARLNVAGGNIRNIALNAAFLAADEDEPVQMRHLLQAAQREYGKLERSITDAEVKGWISVKP
ncbi:ATP-binding protein [Leptolyngbya cf. ectocarpi LEGE 11479]|uniref:ATP-binding protein n=1 Tax=Leptolyngbya cf. ectocarpi LEGE 11479 TaxID=1828722 RepID=A0A928ZZQ6_LEPEC|nr:ATP-binding protein [Leptolyngbya ectocarpi]MBE9070470.1 ATP-binding protein [Leptolyngbya cf. ectocarpi LEGE 11479]